MSADLAKSIELLVLGWGGVFAVILIIYLVSMVLCKLFPVKKK
ncbi:OadG-related small transporter subunit [Vagococcus penaei]|nr:OadG-related small transporter subunit [Vagococcus penaei]